MIKQIKQTEKKIKSNEIAKTISKDLLHQKFIEAALELDALIVEPFIPEDMMLQDMDKFRFLAELQGRFDEIWQQHPEDYRVELANFKCKGCNRGEPLASFEVFEGINLAPYKKFGYYIEKDKDGNTNDIYICFSFK